MKSRIAIVMLITASGFFYSGVYADSFDKGKTTASIAIGSGNFFGENYLIIGGGVGYYLMNGVEAGLDVDIWTGGEPSIYEVTPKLSYVYDNPSRLKPYLGVFFNRTYIENQEDSDAIGYRAGVYMPTGNRAHIGIGFVYKELQDCTETIFYDCSDSYTEVSLIFSL